MGREEVKAPTDLLIPPVVAAEIVLVLLSERKEAEFVIFIGPGYQIGNHVRGRAYIRPGGLRHIEKPFCQR